jgi:hypothetical protein
MEEKHITLLIQCDSKGKLDFGLRLANDDIQTEIICDEAKTTCFTEAQTIVTSQLTGCSKSAPSKIHANFDTIKDFLGKPYLLGQFSWTAATTTGSALITPFSIGALLTSVTQWEVKRRGFNLIRGTFVLRVEVNANPFQAASALIYYLPNYADRLTLEAQFAKRMNINLVQKFQHPNLHFDLRDTAAIFKVPYIAPTPYYDIKAATYDWGHIFMDVVSPLATGLAGNTGVEVSYFGYWEDLEFGAPMVPQSNNAARRSKDREEKELVPSGPIASGLKQAADIVGLGAIVPWLAPACTDVAWALNMMSSWAFAFGWSKPRINTTQTIVAHQEFRYLCTTDGPDVAMPTALISNNMLKVSSEFSITDEDEMSLRFLLEVPFYAGIVQWLSSTGTSDTPLYTKVLGPSIFYGTDAGQGNSITQTDTGHVATYRTGSPLYYMYNFFKFYRGSFKIKIRVIKTIYHSGRLMFTWTPITTVAAVVTKANSIYSLRQILDIREQSEIEFILPWMIDSPYLDVGTGMGTLDVFILNDLKCPETCAQSVDLEIFYTAGPDFEYQCPKNCKCMPAFIYTPQSNNAAVYSGGIANTDVQTVDTMHSLRSIGEHFTSIKQLLNRTVVLQPLAGNLTYAVKNILFYPYFIYGSTMNAGGATTANGPYTSDALSIFAPMYNYIRGGMRYMVQNDLSNYIRIVSLQGFYNGDNSPASATNPLDFTTPIYSGTNVAITNSAAEGNPFSACVPGSEKGTAIGAFPYQSRYPVTFPVVWAVTTPTNLNNSIFPTVSAAFSSCTNLGTSTVVSRGCMDDFQCSFFIGCPPVYISQT